MTPAHLFLPLFLSVHRVTAYSAPCAPSTPMSTQRHLPGSAVWVWGWLASAPVTGGSWTEGLACSVKEETEGTE